MTNNTNEFRRQKRKVCSHSILVCYPSQDGSEEEEKHNCRTEDISEGGLKVVTRRPLALGSTFPLEVHILDQKSIFKFKGEVKWCLETDATPTYSAGIKLLKLVENDYLEWRKIVKN